MGKKIGRPCIYDPEEIADRLEQFIAKHEEPFIQEFLLNEDISETRYYELVNSCNRLKETNKKAIRKQELYILKNAPTGKYNPVFGIFKLKQPCHGWTDKQEVQVNQEVTLISEGDRQARISELIRQLPADRVHELLKDRDISIVDVEIIGSDDND